MSVPWCVVKVDFEDRLLAHLQLVIGRGSAGMYTVPEPAEDAMTNIADLLTQGGDTHVPIPEEPAAD